MGDFRAMRAHQNPTSCFYAFVVKTRGNVAMSLSDGNTNAERKVATRWFSSVAAAATDAIGASRIETLEIVTDVEQVSLLFASLDDVRQGRIVNMSDAFGDL